MNVTPASVVVPTTPNSLATSSWLFDSAFDRAVSSRTSLPVESSVIPTCDRTRIEADAPDTTDVSLASRSDWMLASV